MPRTASWPTSRCCWERRACQTVKTGRDLGGLLYADGIHNTLYRITGEYHTLPDPTVPEPPTARGEVEMPTVAST